MIDAEKYKENSKVFIKSNKKVLPTNGCIFDFSNNNKYHGILIGHINASSDYFLVRLLDKKFKSKGWVNTYTVWSQSEKKYISYNDYSGYQIFYREDIDYICESPYEIEE